ncbi:MAG: peptidylprolyl isomerase [Candidatus Berkelbacteria bacterium]|nr:peptidylprolyl isomerase [Candidatus Berkelbacteria bacterium]
MNFISIVRRTEIGFLKFFLIVGRFFASLYYRVKRKVGPNWRSYLKTTLMAIVILYVIGAVVFGVRLYKQKRFEKIDLIASYVYPFPVAHAGRSFVFDRQLQIWVNSSKKFATKNGVEAPPDLAPKILTELTNYALSSQEADLLNVKLTQKDIDEKFDLSIEGIGSRDQAADFIKQNYGLSLNQFKRMITPMVLVEKLRDEQFVSIKARHILVKDEGKSKELLQKIKDGAKFEDVAKDNSEDQNSKDAGGLLAGGEFLFRDSGLIAEVEDALFKLKAGEISEPVKSEFGWHILKAEERKGTIDLKMDDWLKSLQGKYPVNSWI